MKRVLGFLADYIKYVRELRLLPWIGSWSRGLLDEIMATKLNQFTAFAGLVGVSGVLAATFPYLVGNLIVPAVLALGGVFVFLAMTMYAFRRAQGKVNEVDSVTQEELLAALLALLFENNSLPKGQVAARLGLGKEKANSLLDWAVEEKWIEVESGAAKISESMRPIAQQSIEKWRRNAKERQRKEP